jgi:hypothetical protein
MKTRNVALLALLSLSLASLAACSDAIYATIDTEKKTATNTLSQTISVFDMAVTASAAGSATYYVASGAIFQGTLAATSVSWKPNATDNTRPWNPSGMLCNAMTFYNSLNLYGGFIAQNGSSILYESSVSPLSFGSSPTPISLLSTGEQVTTLSSVGANLFVGGAVMSGNNYVFQLEYTNNPGIALFTSLITGQPYPLVPVAYDGTNYWTASGSTLFESPTALTISSFVANAAQSWGTINGVFASGTTVIVLTKSNGVFYSLNAGGAWTQVQPDHQGTVTVSYLSAAGPIAPSVYLVGSDGYGYYTLNTGSATLSRFGDSTIALYAASVSRIVLDPGNSVVLMGTNSKGLWRTVYDASGNVPASGYSWINE